MLRRFLHAESEEHRTLALDEIARMRPSLRVLPATEADGLQYFPFLLASRKGARAIVALAFCGR